MLATNRGFTAATVNFLLNIFTHLATGVAAQQEQHVISFLFKTYY